MSVGDQRDQVQSETTVHLPAPLPSRLPSGLASGQLGERGGRRLDVPLARLSRRPGTAEAPARGPARLEQALRPLLPQRRAHVRHGERHPFRERLVADAAAGARDALAIQQQRDVRLGREVDGVLDELVEGLAQQRRRDGRPQRRRRRRGRRRQRRRRCRISSRRHRRAAPLPLERLEGVEHPETVPRVDLGVLGTSFLQPGTKLQRREARVPHALLEPRRGEQRADDVPESLGPVARPRDECPGLRIEPLRRDVLEGAAHDRQRRAELVRQAARQALEVARVGGRALQQRGQIPRQLTDLVTRRALDQRGAAARGLDSPLGVDRRGDGAGQSANAQRQPRRPGEQQQRDGEARDGEQREQSGEPAAGERGGVLLVRFEQEVGTSFAGGRGDRQPHQRAEHAIVVDGHVAPGGCRRLDRGEPHGVQVQRLATLLGFGKERQVARGEPGEQPQQQHVEQPERGRHDPGRVEDGVRLDDGIPVGIHARARLRRGFGSDTSVFAVDSPLRSPVLGVVEPSTGHGGVERIGLGEQQAVLVEQSGARTGEDPRAELRLQDVALVAERPAPAPAPAPVPVPAPVLIPHRRGIHRAAPDVARTADAGDIDRGEADARAGLRQRQLDLHLIAIGIVDPFRPPARELPRAAPAAPAAGAYDLHRPRCDHAQQRVGSLAAGARDEDFERVAVHQQLLAPRSLVLARVGVEPRRQVMDHVVVAHAHEQEQSSVAPRHAKAEVSHPSLALDERLPVVRVAVDEQRPGRAFGEPVLRRGGGGREALDRQPLGERRRTGEHRPQRGDPPGLRLDPLLLQRDVQLPDALPREHRQQEDDQSHGEHLGAQPHRPPPCARLSGPEARASGSRARRRSGWR